MKGFINGEGIAAGADGAVVAGVVEAGAVRLEDPAAEALWAEAGAVEDDMTRKRVALSTTP